MYEIAALKSKKLPELQEIAKAVGVKRITGQKKLDLIYQIIDTVSANPKVLEDTPAAPKTPAPKRQKKRQKKRLNKRKKPPNTTSKSSRKKNLPTEDKKTRKISSRTTLKNNTTASNNIKATTTTSAKGNTVKLTTTVIPETATVNRTLSLTVSFNPRAYWKLCLRATVFCAPQITTTSPLPTMCTYRNHKFVCLV